MRWPLFITSIGLLLLLVVLASYHDTQAPGYAAGSEEVRITLTEKGYFPQETTIIEGTTVTFATELDKAHWPASNLHPSHNIYPEFDPKRPLEPTEVWSFTFDRAGTYAFHDHVRSYFRGVIYVVEE